MKSENEAVGEALSKLVRASDLVTDPEDLDVGDHEPGGFYKGFKILSRKAWPTQSQPFHEHLKNRFYVVSLNSTKDKATIGLVPWDGSQIVWPWDAAWTQDLHRTEVQSLLKEEQPRKRK